MFEVVFGCYRNFCVASSYVAEVRYVGNNIQSRCYLLWVKFQINREFLMADP